MRDFRVLFDLRWRQFRDSAVYWMRVLGYDPKARSITQAFYVLYLIGIAGLWFMAMWGWAYYQAGVVGKSLESEALASILNAIPIAILVGQAWVVSGALRSTPLKLSFPDMAYLAGSPIARWVPVFLGFARQMLSRMVIFSAISALIGTMLVQNDLLAGPASLSAALASIPLVVLTWALAWLLGILRLVYPRVGRWRFLWVAPLLTIGLIYVYRPVVLWPGQSFMLAIFGEAPFWLFPLLIVMALGLVGAFVWLGNRINMIHAADESAIFARVQALGLMAYRDPRLQARIRLQASQASRRPWLRLPKSTGFRTLIARGALSYIRHPMMLITCLIWGAVMTQAAVWIIANDLPVQLWIGWLLVIGLAPPVGLLNVFSSDLEEPFLRQFLVVDGFQLLLADVILPIIFLIAGSVIVWLAQGFEPSVTSLGLSFIPLLAILLALCGAVALTNERVLQTRLLATAATFGTAMVAGVNFSPAIAFGVVAFALLALSAMVSQNA